MCDRRKWVWPIAQMVLTVLMVGGCATRPEPQAPPMEPVVEEPAPPVEEEVAPAPPPPPPAFDPRAFLGLTPDEMERRLGKPDLVRGEGEASVWQYVSGPCVLHFFLYPSATDPKAQRVEHVEAKTRPGPWGEGLKPEAACSGEFKHR